MIDAKIVGGATDLTLRSEAVVTWARALMFALFGVEAFATLCCAPRPTVVPARAANPRSTGARTDAQLYIPPPVPHLNRPEHYLVANGIGAASGPGDGRWDFLAGPDYTSPNYLADERLAISVDGIDNEIPLDMRRARATGAYYGTATVGDLTVVVLDHALWNAPVISRFVQIENRSSRISHSVQMKGFISALSGAGRSARVIGDPAQRASILLLTIDRGVSSMFGDKSGWVKTPTQKHLLVAWGQVGTVVAESNGRYSLLSDEVVVQRQDSWTNASCRYHHKPQQRRQNLKMTARTQP